MADWAEALTTNHPSISAETYFGTTGDISLLPRFKDERVGLVTLWRYEGRKPAISFWRSVFERRAPDAIAPIEAIIGKTIGQGKASNHVTAELLRLVEDAYTAGLSGGRNV